MSSQTHFTGKDTTSTSIDVFLQNSTDGTALTGLVAADLTCNYKRGIGALVPVVLSDLVAIDSVFAEGGFKELNSVTAPGFYRLDLPDLLFVTGADIGSVFLAGATNQQPHVIHVALADNIETGTDDRILLSAESDVSVSAIEAAALANLFNTDAGVLYAAADAGSVVKQIATNAGGTGLTDTAIAAAVWAAVDGVAVIADAATAATAPAAIAALNDVDAATVALAVRDTVVEIEGPVTLQEALSLILAVATGRTDTGGTVFRTADGAAIRLTAAVNASNERILIIPVPSPTA